MHSRSPGLVLPNAVVVPAIVGFDGIVVDVMNPIVVNVYVAVPIGDAIRDFRDIVEGRHMSSTTKFDSLPLMTATDQDIVGYNPVSSPCVDGMHCVFNGCSRNGDTDLDLVRWVRPAVDSTLDNFYSVKPDMVCTNFNAFKPNGTISQCLVDDRCVRSAAPPDRPGAVITRAKQYDLGRGLPEFFCVSNLGDRCRLRNAWNGSGRQLSCL